MDKPVPTQWGTWNTWGNRIRNGNMNKEAEMLKRGKMGWTELGWKTVGDCVPDLKLGWSSEGDLGHSTLTSTSLMFDVASLSTPTPTFFLGYISAYIIPSFRPQSEQFHWVLLGGNEEVSPRALWLYLCRPPEKYSICHGCCWSTYHLGASDNMMDGWLLQWEGYKGSSNTGEEVWQ